MQKSYFWVFNFEKCRHMFTQKPVHDCLWKVYSKLEIMSSRVNGLTVCVISIQWNTAQYYKGRNHWFIQQFGWVSMLNEGSLIPKVTFYMVPFTVDLGTTQVWTALVHIYMYFSLNICYMIHSWLNLRSRPWIWKGDCKVINEFSVG